MQRVNVSIQLFFANSSCKYNAFFQQQQQKGIKNF